MAKAITFVVGDSDLVFLGLASGLAARFHMLRKAEALAGIATQKGSLWHAYRRAWATARKHLPAIDVAAAGGWKGVETLQAVYQQADTDTMLRVVLEAGEVREVR